MHSCFIRIGVEILVPKKVCFPRTNFIQCDLCELGNANDNSDDLNDDGDGERIKITTIFLERCDD